MNSYGSMINDPKSGKNRPVKVRFNSSEEAKATVRRAKSLKTSA
jgi:hypothetical protein